jgi:hypothetical protein
VRHDYAGTLRDVWRRNAAYGRGHARAFLRDRTKRWPILFPAPVVLLAALATLGAARSARRALAVVTVAQVLFPQGVLGAARSRRPGDLAFGFVRLVEESAHDVGIVSGIATGIATGIASGTAIGTVSGPVSLVPAREHASDGRHRA